MTTDITTHPLWNDQLALEEEMRSLGISRFRDGVAKMQERGQETRSTAVRRLMGHAHADVVKAIEAFQDAALRGKGGRRHSALPFLKLVGDVDLIAHMTIRSVLDGISSRETLTRVALNVSTLLEDECHFRAFEEWDAGMFARTHKRAMKGTVGNRSRSMLIPARKHGAPLQDWGPRAKLLVGVKLVELFVEATGLATIVRVGAKSAANTPVYVEATPETVKWLQDENARLEWLSPAYMPTIIPPPGRVAIGPGGCGD